MSFVDSISLKILKDKSIIYGKGNNLILRTGSAEEIFLNLKTYDKIHEISCLERNETTYSIACAAGREILITELSDNEFKESFKLKLTDWISSIKLLKDNQIALVTAHNIALLIEVKGGKAFIREKVKCEENSTLYCSFVSGCSWDDLLFFGGTALGELIVWKRIGPGTSQIVHRQFLHNGVIFSIDFNSNYLTTSSDDRSIKIFKPSFDKENSFEIQELHQLFGHTARVFICKNINFDNRSLFLSAGEDSSLCIWSENGELLCKKNVSSSGTIWNLDYCDDLEVVVTCSSTGALNKFRLREILFETHLQIEVSSFDKNAHAAKLKYLKNGSLIVLDSKMEIHMKKGRDWIKVEQENSNQKFVAMEVFENRLFLAGKSSVHIFDYSEDLKELKFTIKIEVQELLESIASKPKLDYLRSIHALSFDDILVCDASGLAVSLLVNDFINQSELKNLFQIPKSVEPWTTAAAKFDDCFWLLGDRVGNLHLFKAEESSSTISTPVQKIFKLHGNLGVTTIRVGNDGFIKTTGNDGTVKTLFIDHEKNSIEIYQCERSLVNWIEKVIELNGREYFLGFNDNYFVIHHNRQIVYEHKCGGRHRHWDLASEGGKIQFAYIQKKKINVVEFLLSQESDDGVQWHRKECNVMTAVEDLLISGGEDTMMKLTRLKGGLKFTEFATVNSHISSIKTIATCHDGDDLLIFSAGGRAQIVVTRLIKMTHAKEEVNFLLTKKLNSFDPETRLTSVFYDESSNFLFVACSDGFIRIFNYQRGSLELITEHFYGKCILKIHVVEGFVLSMATDGLINFWKHETTLKLVDKLQHNQSGINCFDIFQSSQGVFTIGTSGDDAGVFVTQFTVNRDEIQFLKTVSSFHIHSAQVTGLKFLSEDLLYTTAVDQTVCKLQITNSTVKILDRKFTCISDVKGFLFYDKNILVYGAGLEVLENIL